MPRLVSMGSKLYHKASSTGTYAQITDVRQFPAFLGEADRVDTTCIEDRIKTSAPGQQDPGDMAFVLAYTGNGEGTNWKTLRDYQTADTAAYFKVEFPDGSGFEWQAKVALSMNEVGDGNSALEFTATMYPEGEITVVASSAGGNG